MRAIAIGLAVIIFIVLGLTFPDTPIGLVLRMLIPAFMFAFAFVLGLAFVILVIGNFKNRARARS